MDNIGRWLARDRSGSKLHLIESEIADRLVTRCGREMHLTAGGRWMIRSDLGHAVCKVCAGKPL